MHGGGAGVRLCFGNEKAAWACKIKLYFDSVYFTNTKKRIVKKTQKYDPSKVNTNSPYYTHYWKIYYPIIHLNAEK